MVAAVISRTQLPGASIADLEPGDILQTEPEVGADPIVRLTVGTTTVALRLDCQDRWQTNCNYRREPSRIERTKR